VLASTLTQDDGPRLLTQYGAPVSRPAVPDTLRSADLQDGRVVRDRAEITDEVREDLRKFKALLKKL
jgi:hypothetical protein